MLCIHVYCKQKPVPQLLQLELFILHLSNKANKVPFTKIIPFATILDILKCLELLYVGLSSARFLCNSAQTFFGNVLLVQLYMEHSPSWRQVLPLLPIW